MIAHISAVYMDAESGNLIEITVSDGKTNTSLRTPTQRYIRINRNAITVPVSYFHEYLLINGCICAIFLQEGRKEIFYLTMHFKLSSKGSFYASSHSQDNIYHDICYISRGAIVGTRNSSMVSL